MVVASTLRPFCVKVALTLTPLDQEGWLIQLTADPEGRIHQANMTVRLWKVTPLTASYRVDVFTMQTKMIRIG